MKKIFSFLVLVSLGIASFSQESVKNKDYYLQKSKRQRSSANILLIGGTAAVGLGILIGSGKEASFDEAGTGVIIGGIGVLGMLGSVPLYIAAGKNKRKGLSLALHNEKYIDLQKGAMVYRYIPSLSLKINL